MATVTRHERVLTEGGVVNATDPRGEVTLTLHSSGNSIVDMVVDDGHGNTVTVYLDYRALTRLMVAMGSHASAIY